MKHPIIRKNEQLFREIDAGLNVESHEFTVFDTELTGLNTRSDEIVSIAAVRIRDLRVVFEDSFFSLVQTRKKYVGEGTFVHRITPELIRAAPALDEILPQFIDFCGPSTLVGHCPELDLAFLDKASKKMLGGVLRNPCIDAMEMARVHLRLEKKKHGENLPKVRSLNLHEISRAYGLPLFAQHDAIGDALQTACLFLFLVKGLAGHGITSFKDICRVGRVRGVFVI
jgi:DNA polymerase III subunit epsilon